MNRSHLIRWLFDAAAERYARDVAPVLAPLSADFVVYAAPHPADRVLDLGTGTGSLAREIAPLVRQVVGIDLAPAMLHRARKQTTAANVSYGLADLHRLPLRSSAFTLVIVSFGLNAADPDRSLRAIRRVIAPGGRLVIQEWGPEDSISLGLSDLLADFAVDPPGEMLATLRAHLDTFAPLWTDHLQDVDDYRERLAEARLIVDHAAEVAPLKIRLHPDQYFAYWRARTDRFEEIQAMDKDQRAAFEAAAHNFLRGFTQSNRRLTWEPVVFRVSARR